ncbi:MAG TPA: nickel pincer cofactor biosynthesis protein LarC, partial [Polyangia bacterium]
DHGHDHGHDHTPDHGHQHHEHRDYAEIRRLLRRSRLEADCKRIASDIFERIAQAEASLHGVSIDRVAFHEVGAWDSIADVVGAAAAFAWLRPCSVSSTAPVLGSGQIHTAHGLTPVPAPATAAILTGLPVRLEGEGELTTPTGAAILAALVTKFGPPPPLRLCAQGFGAGTREISDRANVLRVLVGEPLGQVLSESAPVVMLLEANIDDMSPQLIEPLMSALFAAGAVDVWTTSILMKKGRPAWQVSALAAPEMMPAVQQAFFLHSTTLGVRRVSMERSVLSRSQATVKTRFGVVPVKLAADGGEVLGATPEFEDCRRLAGKAGVSVRTVLTEATVAASRLLPHKGRRRD